MDDNIEYEKVEETNDAYKKQLYWNMAIGLQQVDNLTPSVYLKQLANENVQGKISNNEVEDLLHKYYETKDLKDQKVSNQQECDLVSTRIVELLNDNSFTLNPITIKETHKYLFKGIYEFAGKYREYNITKDEPILNNKTVNYAPFHLVESSLEHDFNKEKIFVYKDLTMKEKIAHITEFTSSIWQVHPFGEGNTRTTAVVIEKYLRNLGFNVNNDLFKENSLYFRNALVRSNFTDIASNVYPTNEYLLKFYENLLDNGKHVLNNEEMFID